MTQPSPESQPQLALHTEEVDLLAYCVGFALAYHRGNTPDQRALIERLQNLADRLMRTDRAMHRQFEHEQ